MRFIGFEFKNFRSFGDGYIELFPLRKCNVFVGRNNSGKSNVLRVFQKIQEVLSERDWSIGMGEIDRYARSQNSLFGFKLYFESDENDNDQQKELVATTKTTQFFFEFAEYRDQRNIHITDYTLSRIDDFKIANTVLQEMFGRSWGSRVSQEIMSQEFLKYAKAHFQSYFSNQILKPIRVIPVFREIRNGEQYSFDGKNLIRELAQYKNPDIGHDEDRLKFDKVESLLQRLLKLPAAKIEIPTNNEKIIINANGTRLPLDSYGTGVHEVIILATAVVSFDNCIYCIEEPEIHLHPTLQRDFLQFITSETSNEYLITTHSPTLINANLYMPPKTRNEIQVFHLQYSDGNTLVRAVNGTQNSIDALNDLGVKASDLLQTNAIIWVEGPSDRIYINHFLKLLAPDLIEGLHFSIMYYGGRILSHLSLQRSTEENQVPEELIEILKINQRSIVVIDSDKEDENSPLNQTKQRIQQECSESESICWITDGREIENYLPQNVVALAYKEITGQDLKITISNYGKFEKQLATAINKAKSQKIDYAAHKVDFARKFIQCFNKEDVSPILQKQLDNIIQKIKLWNE